MYVSHSVGGICCGSTTQNERIGMIVTAHLVSACLCASVVNQCGTACIQIP